MKRILLSVIIGIICIIINAQVPESFNYQAIPRNGSGGTYPDQGMNIRISILSGSPAGSSVYTETFSATTTSIGLLNLQIGQGTQVSGTFSAIDWGSNLFYIKVEVDPAGGTTYTDMGTTQLLSVPYALNTKSVTGMVNANNSIISNVLTPINNTDAANKEYVDELISTIQVIQAGVRDIDANKYDVIKIGSQIWMAENLKTTKFNDGTIIPPVTDNTAWANLTTPGYCWYDNDEGTYKETYGALYNWYTIDKLSNNGKNVCPTGWHVPTDDDWTTLTTALGGLSVAGGKLKETGTIHWTTPNNEATNETNFTALPGGYRNVNGPFYYIGDYGNWWSALESTLTNAWARDMNYITGSINRGSGNKHGGFSVRCVRD